MGWEWRCFVPEGNSREADTPFSSSSWSGSSRRSDVYMVPLCDDDAALTHSIGVKVRGGKGSAIEVKCRHEVDGTGAELWSKTKHPNAVAAATFLQTEQRRGLDQEGAGPAAGECLTADGAKVRCVHVGKVRTLGGGGGVDSEKTLITATEIVDAESEGDGVRQKAAAAAAGAGNTGSGGGGGGGGDGGGGGSAGSSLPTTQWTSYCIEGSALSAVNASVARWLDSFEVDTTAESSVQAKTVAVFGAGTIVGGYPAWLARLCTQAYRRQSSHCSEKTAQACTTQRVQVHGRCFAILQTAGETERWIINTLSAVASGWCVRAVRGI